MISLEGRFTTTVGLEKRVAFSSNLLLCFMKQPSSFSKYLADKQPDPLSAKYLLLVDDRRVDFTVLGFLLLPSIKNII
jgi:hypothetical protein